MIQELKNDSLQNWSLSSSVRQLLQVNIPFCKYLSSLYHTSAVFGTSIFSVETLLSLVFSEVTIPFDEYNVSCIQIDMMMMIFSRKTLGNLCSSFC